MKDLKRDNQRKKDEWSWNNRIYDRKVINYNCWNIDFSNGCHYIYFVRGNKKIFKEISIEEFFTNIK